MVEDKSQLCGHINCEMLAKGSSLKDALYSFAARSLCCYRIGVRESIYEMVSC